MIVEDNLDELHFYKKLATKLGHIVVGATSIVEAEEHLRQQAVDVMIIDLHLQPGNADLEGYQLIVSGHEKYPNALIVAMSADPNIEIFKKSMKLGANHFIKKPLVTCDEIAVAMDIAKKRRNLESAHLQLTRPPSLPEDIQKHCPDGVLVSEKHQHLVKIIAENAKIPGIIYGETGTGKEEIARLIYKRRVRIEGNIPFVPVNCAHLNNDLANSLLFGHRKGAFSGAHTNTRGFIGEADGGILFLDEIHSLSLECQRKLLRTLNDGTYTRLGETTELKSHFQVVVATTKELDAEVDGGRFLLDLRSRLIGINVELKPLRERFYEIQLLIALFFAKNRVDITNEEFLKLVDLCKKYYWQGNIRQLFNTLQTLVVICEGNHDKITATKLPILKSMLIPIKLNYQQEQMSNTRLFLEQKSSVLQLINQALQQDMPIKTVLAEVEKSIIVHALSRHSSDAEARKALGLS